MRASPRVRRLLSVSGFCWETAPVCRLTRVIGLVTYTASTLDMNTLLTLRTQIGQDTSGAGAALPGGPKGKRHQALPYCHSTVLVALNGDSSEETESEGTYPLA